MEKPPGKKNRFRQLTMDQRKNCFVCVALDEVVVQREIAVDPGNQPGLRHDAGVEQEQLLLDMLFR